MFSPGPYTRDDIFTLRPDMVQQYQQALAQSFEAREFQHLRELFAPSRQWIEEAVSFLEDDLRAHPWRFLRNRETRRDISYLRGVLERMEK